LEESKNSFPGQIFTNFLLGKKNLFKEGPTKGKKTLIFGGKLLRPTEIRGPPFGTG